MRGCISADCLGYVVSNWVEIIDDVTAGRLYFWRLDTSTGDQSDYFVLMKFS